MAHPKCGKSESVGKIKEEEFCFIFVFYKSVWLGRVIFRGFYSILNF